MGSSSYSYGDARTTIPRSDLGDPAKYRLVHGGSEVFHSHHPHGGTIRWLRSPRSSDEMPLWFTAKNGPVKYPVIRTKSDRVDVQVIGPSETFDLDTECGSGLCQQLAGDFLFHCHVAHHYVSGMWGYWRGGKNHPPGGVPTPVMSGPPGVAGGPGGGEVGGGPGKLAAAQRGWVREDLPSAQKGKSNWTTNPATITVKDWVTMQMPKM